MTVLHSGVTTFTVVVLLLASSDREEEVSELDIPESEVIMTPPTTSPAPPTPAYFNTLLSWRICTIVKDLS